MNKTNLETKMKITSTALRTGESASTTINFTDDNHEYSVTLPGDLTNPLIFETLEKGFLNTLTEYELIESITDEEIKLDRLTEYLANEDLADQTIMEHKLEILKSNAA